MFSDRRLVNPKKLFNQRNFNPKAFQQAGRWVSGRRASGAVSRDAGKPHPDVGEPAAWTTLQHSLNHNNPKASLLRKNEMFDVLQPDTVKHLVNLVGVPGRQDRSLFVTASLRTRKFSNYTDSIFYRELIPISPTTKVG